MTDQEKMVSLIVRAKAEDPETGSFTEFLAGFLLRHGVTLPGTSRSEPRSPYTDDNILACPCCGSGEYLENEDGNENRYCGQCGQSLDWSRLPTREG